MNITGPFIKLYFMTVYLCIGRLSKVIKKEVSFTLFQEYNFMAVIIYNNYISFNLAEV